MRASFSVRVVVCDDMALLMAASFSSTEPLSDSMAAFTRPEAAALLSKPFSVVSESWVMAFSIKSIFALRSVVCASTTLFMASSFSAVVVPADFISLMSLSVSSSYFTTPFS